MSIPAAPSPTPTTTTSAPPPAGSPSTPASVTPTVLGTPPPSPSATAPATPPPATTPTGDTTTASPPNGTPATVPDVDVKLPETVDEETKALFDRAKPLFKEVGLDSQKAQKLVDLVLESNKASAAAFQARQEQTFKQWESSLREDKEIGGAQWEASKVAAQKAVARFGASDAELKQFFSSPMGSFPPLVRLMARVGRALDEDRGGASLGAPTPIQRTEQQELDEMYPTMRKAS